MGQKISCLCLVLYDYLTRVRKVRVYFFPFGLYRNIFFWFSTTLYVGNSYILKGNITVPGWLTESRKYVAVLCQFVLILSDFPPFAYFLVNYLIGLPKVHIMLGEKTVTHRLVQSGTRDEKKTCLCFKSSQSCRLFNQRKCYSFLLMAFSEQKCPLDDALSSWLIISFPFYWWHSFWPSWLISFWAFWLSAFSVPLFTSSFHKSSSLIPVNKVVKCHLTYTHYLWECVTHNNKGKKG